MKKLTLMAIALTALTLGAVFLLTQKTCAQQAPTIQWKKYYGGSFNDVVKDCCQTTDSGYILAGTTDSYNGNVSGSIAGWDGWVIKLNSMGKIQWKKCYGTTGDDQILSIACTNDGGYIMVGLSTISSGSSNSDAWVIKINSIGIIEWQNYFGGSKFDVFCSVKQTTDQGYIVAGYTQSNDGSIIGNHDSLNNGTNDAWLIKFDSIGIIQWQRCYGGLDYDMAFSVEVINSGGYIFTGQTSSNEGDVFGYHGGTDVWVVKVDLMGNIQWQKCLGGNGPENSTSISKTIDNCYIVSCNASVNNGDVVGTHGGNDYWIVKLNASGNIIWKKCFGGSLEDYCTSVIQTSDSGYMVAGNSFSNDLQVFGNHGNSDVWILKLSASGKIQWKRCYGTVYEESIRSIIQTFDGGYFFAGDVISTPSQIPNSHGGHDYWPVKLGFNQLRLDKENIISFENEINAYPNPVNDYLTINTKNDEPISQITICDILGHVLVENNQPTNTDIKTDMSDFKPGIYFLKIQSDSGVITKKIIKE